MYQNVQYDFKRFRFCFIVTILLEEKKELKKNRMNTISIKSITFFVKKSETSSFFVQMYLSHLGDQQIIFFFTCTLQDI